MTEMFTVEIQAVIVDYINEKLSYSFKTPGTVCHITEDVSVGA